MRKQWNVSCGIAVLALVAASCAGSKATSPDSLVARDVKDLAGSCAADAPVVLAPISPSATLDSPLRARLDQNQNAAWAARHLPGGWGGGGFYRRPGADLAFYMKHPAQRDALLDSLAKIPEAAPELPVAALRQAAVLQARWDFAELYDWSTYLLGTVGFSNHIIGWDINEATNRIQWSIHNAFPEAVTELDVRLRQLGVPCGLVTYELMAPAVALSARAKL